MIKMQRCKDDVGKNGCIDVWMFLASHPSPLTSHRAAFTLAEMLIVLLIVSIIATASVPLVYKRFRIPKDKTNHGKYECYRDAAGDLYEKQWENNIQTKMGTAPVASCSFTPPSGATYFIVQGVGGGGGGAYNGTLRAAVTTPVYNGTIEIPTNGTVATSYAYPPSWLSSALTNEGITLTATVYGGGGGGGCGNDTVNQYQAGTCSTGNYDNTKAELTCRWYYGSIGSSMAGTLAPYTITAYVGQAGGAGGTRAVTSTLQYGMTIATTTGSAGSGAATALRTGSCGTASAGGSANVTLTSSGGTTLASGTATGGFAGANAANNANYSPTTAAAGSGSSSGGGGTGGAGGIGLDDPGTSKPADYYKAGSNGGTRAPVISRDKIAGGGDADTVTYSFGYYTKEMPYGAGGSAGEYRTAFFRKLSGSLVIDPGVGGTAGDGTTSGGGAGGDTTITTASGGTALTAEGKAGATTLSYTPALNLYEVNANSGYLASQLSSLNLATGSEYNSGTGVITITGGKGASGNFVLLKETQTGGSGTYDATWGSGGDGSGSYSGIGFVMSKTLNGTSYNDGAYYPSGTVQTTNYNAVTSAKSGKPGAVIIIW